MPSIPLVACETANSVCHSSCSGGADTMCRQGSHLRLSAEEEAAAEESLLVYCKPVELYNILRHRAVENPLYLQRCMRYKLEEKHKKRIHLTVSLYVPLDHGLQFESLFPLYVMLAKTTSNSSIIEQSARCRFKRCFTLSTCAGGDEETSRFSARFVLPERNKLLEEIKNESLAILFICCVGGGHIDFASCQTQGGQCLLGKTPMKMLDLSCGRSPNMREGSKTLMAVDLHPCVIETSCVDRKMFFSFRAAPTPATKASIRQLDVIFTAENFGAKDQMPYELYSYRDIASSSLWHLMRLRNGDVVFNYMYYNNKLQRTEVSKDFSCPLCLVKCASFKGLKCHLLSSHDLFKFEFRATEDYQAVNVYVKGSEIVEDGLSIRTQPFSFCSKPRRRTKPKSFVPNGNHVHPSVLEPDLSMAGNANVLESDLPMATNEARDGTGESVHGGSPGRISMRESRIIFQPADIVSTVALPRACVTTVTTNHIIESVDGGMSEQNIIRSSEVMAPSADSESTIALPGNSVMTVTTLQNAVIQQRSVDHDTRIHALPLQRRRFYHSHQAQPMDMQDLLSGWDSEQEIDHDIADLQDRRMLNDFIDVTNDEKQMMHMWNSFVRRQRVLADGHIPWACENFSRLHAEYLVQTPSLLWCWRIFMIKLWKHGLLNNRAINNCNLIFQQLKTQQNNNTPLLIKSHDDKQKARPPESISRKGPEK